MIRTGEEESLLAGDRVALLVPGSPAYVDLGLALLADAPDLVVTSQEQLAQLRAARPGRSRSLPLGRPIHCTSGTTGTPKGVWSGLLPHQDATALVAEERDLWAFAGGSAGGRCASHVLVARKVAHSPLARVSAYDALAGGA